MSLSEGRGSIAIAAVFVAVSATYLWFARQLPQTLGEQPGPGRLPVVIGIAMLSLSLFNLSTSAFKYSKRFKRTPYPGDAQADDGLPANKWAQAGGALVALASWPVLLPLGGFAIANFVVVAGINRAAGEKRPIRNLVVGTVAALAAQAVFVHLMELNVPQIGVAGL